MRSVIGWMAALLGSALLGAAVYQTVLSKPLPELDPTATVETISGTPEPGPTLYRTEVRTIVEPTPTVTVDDEVLIEEEVTSVSQPGTSDPAPARTSAPEPRPQATAEREDPEDADDDSARSSDDDEDEREDSEDEADEPDDEDPAEDSDDQPDDEDSEDD